jgi:hypothetical protein
MLCVNFDKNGLGYILGDYFRNSSGHPGLRSLASSGRKLLTDSYGIVCAIFFCHIVVISQNKLIFIWYLLILPICSILYGFQIDNYVHILICTYICTYIYLFFYCISRLNLIMFKYNKIIFINIVQILLRYNFITGPSARSDVIFPP